jgi:hypothetical protein
LAASAQADIAWTGGGADDQWWNTDNWSGGTPAYGVKAVIDDTSPAGKNVVSFPTEGEYYPHIGWLTLNKSTGFTINKPLDSSLYVDDGTIEILNTGATYTIPAVVTYASALNVSVAGGSTLVFSDFTAVGAPVAMTGTGRMVIHGGSTLSNSLSMAGGTVDIDWVYDFNMMGLSGSGAVNFKNGNLKIDAAGMAFTGQLTVMSADTGAEPTVLSIDTTTASTITGTSVVVEGAAVWWQTTNLTMVGGGLGGDGTVMLNTNQYSYGTARTLTGQGIGITGSLNMTGNLALAKNGTINSRFTAGVVGTGTTPGVLAISRDSEGYGNGGLLTGLDATDLVLDIPRSGWASYVGATLTIVTAANDLTLAGTFNSVTWNNNMVGQVNYTAGAITLTHVGLAGDGNNDGAIDATDYANWFNNYGTTPTSWDPGDFNGDGSVDATDYALWFNNYGAGASGGPVPEPATMALLVLGSLAMLRRRK